jgi:hypothetical protein
MRRSSRKPPDGPAVPYRIKQLFHAVDGEPTLTAKLERLHGSPGVYLVRNFLSASEIEYFDRVITRYGPQFESSFTQDDQERVISEERTSQHIHLSKGQDRVVRSVERKVRILSCARLSCPPLLTFDLHLRPLRYT